MKKKPPGIGNNHILVTLLNLFSDSSISYSYVVSGKPLCPFQNRLPHLKRKNKNKEQTNKQKTVATEKATYPDTVAYT